MSNIIVIINLFLRLMLGSGYSEIQLPDIDIKQIISQPAPSEDRGETTGPKASAYIEGFRAVHQLPQLPTGCEITALTQTLNFYGYNVSKTYMADNYLTTAEFEETDFNNAFAGSPYSSSAYGCYAPVIERDANRFFSGNGNLHRAYNITGADIETLYEYVYNGTPVILWATICMLPPYSTYVWDYNGEPVYFISQEHCMTLIGYDKAESTVTIADPWYGYEVKYSMSLFEQRYEQLGKMAIVIVN